MALTEVSESELCSVSWVSSQAEFNAHTFIVPNSYWIIHLSLVKFQKISNLQHSTVVIEWRSIYRRSILRLYTTARSVLRSW